MKNWKYRNDTTGAVIWRDRRWEPGDEGEVRSPIPPSLGLTCLQEGDGPDPVLLPRGHHPPAERDEKVGDCCPWFWAQGGPVPALRRHRRRGVPLQQPGEHPNPRGLPLLLPHPPLGVLLHPLPHQYCRGGDPHQRLGGGGGRVNACHSSQPLQRRRG